LTAGRAILIYGIPLTGKKVKQVVKRLQTRIVKAVKYCRVLYGALSMLEPCEVKVSRRVLRGESSRKAADLPGGPYTAIRLIKAKSAVSNPTDLPGFQD